MCAPTQPVCSCECTHQLDVCTFKLNKSKLYILQPALLPSLPLPALPDAYKTLKDCGEQKETLTTHIEETNDKIRNKRKHLESLREELRVLGACTCSVTMTSA